MTLLYFVLVLGTVGWVMWPFFSARAQGAAWHTTLLPHRENLLAEKRRALQAIRELEFDYAMGKLTETDYQTLRHTYAQQAVAVLDEVAATETSLHG